MDSISHEDESRMDGWMRADAGNGSHEHNFRNRAKDEEKTLDIPLEADKIISGFSGLVAIAVTHPLCPIEVC